MRNIRDVLNTPVTFPVELTLTTGQTFQIEHPDFTYLNPTTGDLWYFPKEGAIEVFDPAHIVTVKPKRWRPMSWLGHFFAGSKE